MKAAWFWKAILYMICSKEEIEAIKKLNHLRDNGVEIINDNGGFELQFRDDEARKWYYDQVFGKFRGKYEN